MINSKIQWTDATWNIARGCTKVDEDCKFCYMYRDSMNSTRYDPLEIIRTKTVFNLPLTLTVPSKIFTCSLTDFFHEAVDSYRNEAWEIIRKCPQHTFQILTKRPERIDEHLPPDWGTGWKNVWLGTSVGSDAGTQRIRDLLQMKGRAKVLFLSAEPLHGPLDLQEYFFPYRMIKSVSEENRTKLIDLLDWVIVGGESGHDQGKYRYRPCELEWIENIVSDCKKNHIPVFVKQLGTHLSKQLKMSDRHGGDINEFPEHLRVREFPITH
jgi:protein gp37